MLNILPRIQHILGRIETDLSLPARLWALVIAFITPLYLMVGVVMFFVTLDTLSAIYKQYRKNRQRYDQLHSSQRPTRLHCLQLLFGSYNREKFEHTITKVFSYPVILLACYVFDRLVLGVHLPEEQWFLKFSFTNYMFVLIAALDFISFINNMGEATGLKIWIVMHQVFIKKLKEHDEDLPDLL